MNDTISDQVIDSSNLPANKKAKAIQKRRAAENSIEALQLKKSAAIYLRVSSEMQVDGFSIEAQKIACLKYAALGSASTSTEISLTLGRGCRTYISGGASCILSLSRI